jgi:hypothetical protein
MNSFYKRISFYYINNLLFKTQLNKKAIKLKIVQVLIVKIYFL